MLALQRFLPLGVRRVRHGLCLNEESFAFGFCLVSDFAKERGALAVEVLVLALEFVALFLRFGFFCIGVGEFRGDPFFPRIDGVENGLIKKALHQPHQDEEVERLRPDGKPVDQHRSYFPAAWAMTWFQKGLAKIRIIETTKQ